MSVFAGAAFWDKAASESRTQGLFRLDDSDAWQAVTNGLPEAVEVRVITEAMGWASVEVRVRASNSSTQENMNRKNSVTPMPERIIGMNTWTKKRGKL